MSSFSPRPGRMLGNVELLENMFGVHDSIFSFVCPSPICLPITRSMLANSNSVAMLDPEKPHIVSSDDEDLPISVSSNDEPQAADKDIVSPDDEDLPIFGPGFPAESPADTIPGFPAESADPSVKSIDRTGSDTDDEFDSCVDHSMFRWQHFACSDSWTSKVYDSLSTLQIANLIQRGTIEYGDDCSGARAPLEALCQFMTKLAKEDIILHIKDKFASECPGPDGDGPRKFIAVQCPPEIMFNTVHRGTAACGMDVYTGKRVLIPTQITVYSTGWVCRDTSTINCHPRPLLPPGHPEVVAGTAGASSQTLASSLKYVEIFRPEIALLENLVNKKNILIATNALKATGGYSTCVLLCDSRSFSVPMSRRRLYILAVQTHLLTAHLGELVSQLRDIIKKIPPVSNTSLPKLLDAADGPSRAAGPSRPDGPSRPRWPLMTRRRLKTKQWVRHHNYIKKNGTLKARQRSSGRSYRDLLWLHRCLLAARSSSVFIGRLQCKVALIPVSTTLCGTSPTPPTSAAPRIHFCQVWLHVP